MAIKGVQKKMKNVKTLVAVTHTHTHTQVNVNKINQEQIGRIENFYLFCEEQNKRK